MAHRVLRARPVVEHLVAELVPIAPATFGRPLGERLRHLVGQRGDLVRFEDAAQHGGAVALEVEGGRRWLDRRHGQVLADAADHRPILPSPPLLRATLARVAKKSTSAPERTPIDLGLPTPPKVPRKQYDRELLALQVELVKMQLWARDTGARVVLLFEGRDTAGKGGTIARLREHLNPRFARHVALPVPSDAERGQWYFQRYVKELPTAGEIVFFDRSWYNRAGVERVMGFATPEQIGRFFRQVVPFESFLVNDGTHLVKIWLEISQDEQRRRLESRRTDPLKQWKISPIDDSAPDLWDQYTAAMAEMLMMTDAAPTPWWFVNNNDKRTGRLNVIRHVLDHLPYENKDPAVAVPPDPAIVRPAREVVAALPARA